MDRRFAILCAAAIFALAVILVVAGLISRGRVRRTFAFAEALEKHLHQDARFASLRVIPSTANRIDIMGRVADASMIGEVRSQVQSLRPPVPVAGRLYVGGPDDPPPKDFGKGMVWIITPQLGE